MSRNTGPCFEFVMHKDGARIEFAFLPGNVAKHIYEDTQIALKGAFKGQYGISASDFIRDITLEDGSNVIAIYQTKILSVLKLILESDAFKNYKIKITGVDKEGHEMIKLLNTPVEAIKEAAEVVPYFNKKNNDLTTTRRK